jgi:hypothetical protein
VTFRHALGPLFLFYSAGNFVGGTAIVLFLDGLSVDLPAYAWMLGATVVLSLFFAVLTSRLFPVRLSSIGISGFSFWGRRTSLRWSDVRRARAIHLANLRYLRIVGAARPALYVPLQVRGPGDFGRALLSYLPDGNPLERVFGDAH